MIIVRHMFVLISTDSGGLRRTNLEIDDVLELEQITKVIDMNYENLEKGEWRQREIREY